MIRSSISHSFYTLFQDGIVLTVKVKPGVSKARDLRVIALADGREALEVVVSAPPENGKANKAVCAALAEALGVGRSAVTLKAGQTGRLKLVQARGVRAQDIEERALLWR